MAVSLGNKYGDLSCFCILVQTYHHTATGLMHRCIQSIVKEPSLCTACMALACDIYMSSPASKKGKIPYLAASVLAMIFYLFIELNPKCDSLRQSFFACQKIRRDNLALVTLHYSRQWNIRDSVVAPRWRKHKGCALGQYRPSMVITVTAIQPCGAPQVATHGRWKKTWEAN